MIREFGPPGDFSKRRYFTQAYAWAVPSKEAIEIIRSNVLPGGLLECFAGRGLWARLLSDYMFVMATDANPGAGFFTVFNYTAMAAVERFDYPNLLFCWPPYRHDPQEEIKKWISLNSSHKLRFFYIGEWNGCTATESFHDYLDTLKRIGDYDLTQWDGLHDRLYIYEVEK